METIEERLYKYAEYKKQIEELETQMREILDKKDALAERMLKGQSLDTVRVMGGFSSDPVFAAVQKMVDEYGKQLDRIRRMLVDLYYMVNDTDRMIREACLDEAEMRYVRTRYFQKYNLQQTAARIGYSERQICRIRQKVLEKLEKCQCGVA